MACVPFSIPRLYAGLGRCQGVLHDDGDALRFEFQIQDKFGGWLKSRVKQVRVPVKEIDSVHLRKGWMGRAWKGVKIIIQSTGMTTLSEVPGMKQGQVILNVARKDVAAAEAFVEGLHTFDEQIGR